VATPAPEAAQGVHHSPEERAVDGADDPTGATARQGSRPRPTTARVGPYREAEDVALLLGLSGHRDPRRMTHTASARQSTLPAVLNLLWRMARVSLLGDPATGSATTWKRGCPGRTATPCPERGISPERGSLPVAPQIAPFWPLIRSTGPRSRALATMSVWPRLAEVPLGDVPDGRAEMTGGRYPPSTVRRSAVVGPTWTPIEPRRTGHVPIWLRGWCRGKTAGLEGLVCGSRHHRRCAHRWRV